MKVRLDIDQGNPPRNYVWFLCPGCKGSHHLPVTGKQRPVWSFNGDIEKPTLSPSILASSEWTDYGDAKESDWGPWTAHPTMPGVRQRELKPEAKQKGVLHKTICHSFVRGGRIEFLSDCTHDLKGKTVDLPDLNESDSTPR